MEAKPFASLSSGLLARKGAARPAMRPQGFTQVGNGLEDLGWNDMGFEPPKPADVARDASHDAFGAQVVGHPRVHPTGLTPVQSPVHDQQAEIVERLNGCAPEGEPTLEESAAEEFDETAELCDGDGNFESYGPLETVVETPAETVRETAVESLAETLAEPFSEIPTILDNELLATLATAVPVSRPKLRNRSPGQGSALGKKARAAFTLRLDPDRHLRLRLACAVDGRSAQQLVTDALDQLLNRMPELEKLAAKASNRG